MVWFCLVIFWFDLVWFWIIWCMTIVQICYHAKSGACSFKNDRVMPILVKFGLVWHGLVWFELSARVLWLLHEVLWGIHRVLWGFHEVFPALLCLNVAPSVSEWVTNLGIELLSQQKTGIKQFNPYVEYLWPTTNEFICGAT